MGWMRLPDGRSILPSETVLEFEKNGGRYRITGEPIGYGGSGILYPAVRLTQTEEGWKEEEMRVALKECYPLVRGDVLVRDEFGRIHGEHSSLYFYAKEMMRREKSVTGQIYNRGFRLVPVWGVAEKERISTDGKQFAQADNLYGIMERLDEKGTSLGRLLGQRRGGCFTAYESICIINQVLRSLEEVHENGFLHGDIQENNIFMKGSDPEKGETGEVSLIDFGSARPFQEDGATAPIADRNLYTTSGYTAPECISDNDGTLRLTRAADLYSVGYLMLRMFTGKAMDARTLQLVVNGKYFYERQAKKIGCPSGSVESVNKILLKALQREPAMRYQTAEEMLDDTLRLERALSPKKSAIASVDYRAFISYCHEEKSMQAAELVQKLIERYKIPKAVRPSDERKRLGKVFRDREELSSSNDMEVHLREALAHSEYLIVLLSPGVPLSPWVGREIELFLQYHDREHILTMIVEGEPEEVFPAQLRQDEKYDGRSMKLQQVESLAADIRGDNEKERKKKLKTEIYRLLAPMLGCSYDDLRQRQKEYRLRNLVRTMTAAVVFLGIIAGYIGWQAYQIHENYWATLVKQSRYLAQVSSELLNQGDRIKAIAVAMEALPSGEADHSRPRVAEAEAALARALYSYQGTWSRSRYLKADRLLSMEESSIGAETVSPDGTLLLAADQGGNVYLWNIASGSCVRGWDLAFLHSRGISGTVAYCNFLSDEEVLLVTEDVIAAGSISDGEVRIIRKLERNTYGNMMCALSENREFLALYEMDLESVYAGWDGRDIPDHSMTIYRTSDGEIMDIMPVATELEPYINGMLSFYAGEMIFDTEGKYTALALSQAPWEDDPDFGVLFLADLQKHSYRKIEDDEMNCQNVCFLDNGNAVVFGYKTDIRSDMYEVTVPGKISCYDPSNGKNLWEKSIVCQKKSDESAGLLPTKVQIDGKEQEVLLLWCNRELLFLDGQTGEELWSCTCEESVAGIQQWKEGWILATREGNLFTMNLEDQTFLRLGTNVQRETSNFLYSEQEGTAFLITAEEGAVAVLKTITDDNFCTAEIKDSINQVSVPNEGAYYAVCTGKGDLTGEITFYDMENNQEEAAVPLDSSVRESGWIKKRKSGGDSGEGRKSGGGSEDGRTVFCYVENVSEGGRITAYDVAEHEILWQKQTEYAASNIQFFYTEENGALAVLSSYTAYEKTDGIELLDLQTGEAAGRIPAPEVGSGFDMQSFLDIKLSASGRYLMAVCRWESFTPEAESVSKLQIFDRKQECWILLPKELQDLKLQDSYTAEALYPAQKKDMAAVYEEGENRLLILDLEHMEILWQIPFYGRNQRQMAFMPGDERILLWGDDGYLKLWDMEQECFLMEDSQKFYYVTDIITVEGSDFIEIWGRDESKKEFFNLTYGMDTWLYLWEEDGRFYPYVDVQQSFLAKVNGKERICSIGSGSELMWYDCYTLDELLKKAREVTGGYTLTETERNKYYIGGKAKNRN